MKIDFKKEHKDKILYYINEYKNISEEESQIYKRANSLQKELDELTAKLKNAESNLQYIREEEKKYLDELHDIYGDFTLNDLWETINN